MKVQFILSFLAAAAFPAVQAQEDAAANDCGALGVFNVDLDSLPANVDPNLLRHCADHPLGPARDIQAREEAKAQQLNHLMARDCLKESTGASGCTDGYCWRRCGTGRGPWCWSAHNDGWGSWITCSKDRDCTTSMACGQGECAACGCSC